MADETARHRFWRWPLWAFGSGPAVGGLFARTYAIICLIAWLSLGAQVRVLIGSRGLLPAADFIAAARTTPDVSFLDLPSIFWWVHSDAALVAGVAAGALLSLAALYGWRRRLCFALATGLYISYATVARDFLGFQWDNLLIECGLLAAFLPTDRRAPSVHLLFRLLLFKLYFESGIAKWQSPLHDWQDGSAMTVYYETAPLPTALAFFAHHLPVGWHHFESRATLVLELVVPLAIFGPRPARLGAAALFTLFQIANAATANYGFFCYLAAALHLFLLDDGDFERVRARLEPLVPARLRHAAAVLARWSHRAPAPPPSEPPPVGPRWLAGAGVACFVLVSLAEATLAFGEPGRLVSLASPILDLNQRLRLVNTYHLFQAITRERIEPEFQTLAPGRAAADDDAWTAHDLRHKPGDPHRAPDFVAPHQPRVDFQLWFYGLRFQYRQPVYVTTLVERLCEDPAAVQPLFRDPLPEDAAAVRIVYWQYTFASAAHRRATGAWWRRERFATSRPIPCPHT
jgi:hypothetical protein